MRPHRVLYLAFYARLGGAELYLASLLESLDRRRFAPLVVLGEDGPLAAKLEALGVPVQHVALDYLVRGARRPTLAARRLIGYGRALSALTGLARRSSIGLIHAVDEPALKYGGVVARLVSARAVGTLPDALLPPYGWLHRRGIVWSTRLFYDRLLVPSDANRDLLLAAGLAPGRVTTLHTGVDLDRFAAAGRRAAAFRQGLGIDRETPLIGAVGRFAPVKGQEVLVRAMAEVARRRADARCVIVGDALFEGEWERKRAVEDAIARLGLGGRVILAGWLDDVAPCLAALDLLVHPSTGHDSFPTAVLEAMAAGCPVVASRVGGVPELVEDGATGWLVPPGDPEQLASAIVRALGDETLRRAMGEAGRARAQRFDRRRHAAALAELYDELLAAERRPGTGSFSCDATHDGAERGRVDRAARMPLS